MPPKRIVVFGTTGSGKSTLAKAIGLGLGIPHFELDALNWGSNWTPCAVDEFRRRVEAATAPEAWVTEGNYSTVRDIVLARAQLAVWLDYPFAVVLCRLVGRTFRRVVRKEELWNGNRESLRKAFSRDSIVVWAFQTHWRRRKTLPESLRKYPHLEVLHFRSPRQTERWLRALPHPEKAESALQ